ncbi:MAG: S41 family peptidase [Dysgonamonadaceae bacterium]|nr:S41 family peptidase [Dysgonamonadaceae bacterium]
MGKKNFKILGYTLLALLVGFIAGELLSRQSLMHGFFQPESNKISLLLDIIDNAYVDEVSIHDLTEQVMPKLMAELDPHSAYIPADEFAELKADMEGQFAGVGIEYCAIADTMVVLNIIKGGPAEQAGLMPGDRIITVNNLKFTGDNFSEEKIRNNLRGSEGITVQLQIQRRGENSLLNYSVVRRNIPLTTIKAYYKISDNIGLIKIYDSFSANTYNEFIKAMAHLLSQGCSKFIIDLRSNSGGVIDAAVNICNEFLSAGSPIVYAEGNAFPREEIQANGLGSLQENPLVILVDQFSASASEIVAGAIQDNDRGLIIGRRTFGKGLIQNQIELSDSSAVRLTIARYFTPSGRNIQRKYELGKAEEYNEEFLDRFSDGEEFHEDSVHQNEQQLFYTKKGRKVYGGGGVMPDIFVPLDTAEITSYYINLDRNNIFRQYSGEYSDANRVKLSEFKDHNSMLDYLKTQPILYDITHFAEKYGIKRRSNLINISSRSILRTTYAQILGNFFGEETFFVVAMEGDPIIGRAVEILNNNNGDIKSVLEGKTKGR